MATAPLCHEDVYPAPLTPSWPAPAGQRAPRRRWLFPAACVGLDALAIYLPAVGRLPIAVALAGVAAAVSFAAIRSHYRRRLSPLLRLDAGDLVVVALVASAVDALLAPAGQVGWNALRNAVAVLALLFVGRAATYGLVALLGHHGWLTESALIIGAGRVGVDLARVLTEHPRYGLRPVGFVDDFGAGETLPIPLLGGVRQLDSVLEAYGIRRVLVAFGATREPDMVPIIRACDGASIDIHVLPRFFELGHGAGRDVDLIWGFPLHRLRRAALRPGSCQAKRIFDLLVAALLISVLSPLYASAAVAVRLSGRGPILFRQKRVGSRGRVFEVLKFRTLSLNDDSDTRWSVTDDQRITPVGRILRRTCVDELPQLINVLRGDMSIVGPRPERPYFVSRFTIEVPRYDDRHRVQVGLTGWAQIHGLRGDTSVLHRSRFDNDYIENWSLWLDVVILARTAVEILRSCLRRSH